MRFQLTQAHERALTAALGTPDVALNAYSRWRSDGHEPDVEERRLLAMIAANLSHLLPDDHGLAEIQRNRRSTMARHIRRAANCRQVADVLRAEGIDNLFFKGVGMLPWYPDPSVRTMFDADLLVPWQWRHEAIDLLAAQGFTPVYRRLVDEMHALTETYPGWGMRQADGTEIDVHWRPLHHLRQRPHVDANLFAMARVVTIAGAELNVPDPSHHLVLVAAHGMRATSEAQLISLADASQLLRSADFDPARAASLGREYERTSAVIESCTLLERLHLSADLAEPIAALRRHLRRRTVADRLIGRAASAPVGRAATRAQVVSDTWSAATTTSLRMGGPPFGLLDVARKKLGVRQVRDIPGQALWLLAGRPAMLERFRADRGTPADRRLRLTLSDQVEVGKLDALTRLLPSGWWELEDDHVWTQGRESVIDFQLDLGAARQCTLALALVPFITDANPVLTVKVRVNRRPAAKWEYSLDKGFGFTQRIAIDDTMLDNGRCQIMFLVDGATSPQAAGVSEDPRVVGLSFTTLGIEPVVANHSPSHK